MQKVGNTDATCEKCGGCELVSCCVNTSLGLSFTPLDKIKAHGKQELRCDVCKTCGHIQNWRVSNPQLI